MSEVMDGSAGLTYMQQRYMDPTVGVFLSVDPVMATAGHNFNRSGYAARNPYKFIDPDGRDCVSKDGITTCTIPVTGSKILSRIQFETPPGLTGTYRTGSPTNHVYDRRTAHQKSDAAVQRSIVNDPTPGEDAPATPATPAGTLNAATPKGGRGLLARASALLGNDPKSPVKSYTTNDRIGNVWVINVTQSGHGLHFGYVLRGSVNGEVISIGEGWAAPQAVPVLSGYINDVWVGHNQRNIDDAH